jgi:type I site-specific restriction endonuclease
MIKLDFPEYHFNLRNGDTGIEIFDPIRKKFVALTPEEWVRQHVIRFLKEERQVPLGRMNTEVALKVLKMYRRADIVVFDNFGKPAMIVECKAPNIKITQNTFDQVSRYNIALKASHLMVTNGLQHYCCFINIKNKTCHFLENTPSYQEMLTPLTSTDSCDI